MGLRTDNFKIFHRLLQILVAMLALFPAFAQAANGEMKLSLESFYKNIGIKPSEVKAVMTAYVNEQQILNNGVISSDVDLDFVSITIKDINKSDVPSLLLKFNQGEKTQVLASRYFAGERKAGNYAVVEKEGQIHVIDSSDFKVEVKLFGNPCRNHAASCQLRMPSWAVLQRYHSANVPTVPKFLVLIQHVKGLSLFNGESGALWQYLPLNDAMNALGIARQIAYDGKGVLDIAFSDGHAFIDFSRDVLMIIDNGKIAVSRDGLANIGSSGDMRSIIEVGAANKLLFASHEGVLWKDRVINGDVVAMAIDENAIQAHKFERMGIKGFLLGAGVNQRIGLVVKSEEQTTFNFMQLVADGDHFKDSAASIDLGKISEQSVFIMSNNLYVIGKDGLYLVNGSNQRQPTSLSMSEDKLYQVHRQSIMAQQIKDSQCYWRVYQRAEQHPASLMDSGLEASCGLLNNLSQSQAGVVVTTFTGKDVNLYYHLD